MLKIDKNLPLHTEINDPVLMSVLDTLSMQAKELNYNRTYRVLRRLRIWYRINMVANKRKREEAIIRGYVSVVTQDIQKRQSKLDVLFEDRKK